MPQEKSRPLDFGRLAQQWERLANKADTDKVSHLSHDFGQLELQTARLLDKSTNDGAFPNWAKLRTAIETTLFALAKTPLSEDERVCRLLAMAQSNWLAGDYATRYTPKVNALDWAHYKRDESVAPVYEYMTDEEAAKLSKKERKALALPNGRVVKSARVPDAGIVRDESDLCELDGDEADARHRWRLRAEARRTTCSILAEIAEEANAKQTGNGTTHSPSVNEAPDEAALDKATAGKQKPAWKRLTLRRSSGGDLAELDGETYRLSGAGDADFLIMLKKAKGQPVPGRTLETKAQKRPDRVYKALHEALQKIIEKPGRGQEGYRML